MTEGQLRTPDASTSSASWLLNDITVLAFGSMLIVGFYFRSFLLSGGEALYGHDGDPSFANVIHEYLYQAVVHHENLRDLPFFFPAKGVIGYSDAFLLDLPIYSAFRVSGLDPFVSFEWLLISLMVVGFLGFYCAVRLLLRVNNVLLAAAGAAVGTVPNNFVAEAVGHAQQFAQSFLVWAALLSLLPIVRQDLFSTRVALARWFSLVGGLMFGLAFATTFYPTWFFALYCLIVVSMAAIILWRSENLGAAIHRHFEPRTVIWWLAGLVSGLAVFVYFFVNALHTVGTRTIAEYLSLAHTASDVLNVSSAELLWGRLVPIQRVWPISSFDQPGHSFAVTPILLLTCAMAAGYWWNERRTTNPILRSLILGAVASMGLVFLITLKHNEVTLFEVVRRIVPGAGAIRVGMRGQIIASALAALVVTASAAHILDVVKARFARAIVWIVLGIVVVEQINMYDVHVRQHKALLEMVESTPVPPADCEVVYFTGRRPSSDRLEDLIARELWEYKAMWRALAIHKPTIDGASGWDPPGWSLSAVDPSHVHQAARDWAALNGLHNLCSYDVEARNWRKMEP